MSRTRQILATVVTTALLLVLAGPATAGPAPLDEGGGGGGTVPSPGASGGSDPSIWMYVGFATAGLLVIAVIAFAAVALDRHAHHASQPA